MMQYPGPELAGPGRHMLDSMAFWIDAALGFQSREQSGK